MNPSVWLGEGLTAGCFVLACASWALVYRAHVRDWPTPARRARFLRRATPMTWVVTVCFLLTFAIQVLKWRGVA